MASNQKIGSVWKVLWAWLAAVSWKPSLSPHFTPTWPPRHPRWPAPLEANAPPQGPL